MKYVITGGAGNISKPLTEKLLKAGHEVIVVARNAEHLKELVAIGAKTAIGTVEDPEFLKKAFAGADAVYTMVPPNWNPTKWKDWIDQIGKNYATAIAAAKVKYVVNLSSVGAHLKEGTGPVTGLHRVEQTLNNLEGVNVKHLRACYFFANLLSNTSLVKHMNIMGSNFGGENFKMVFADTNDVADVAFEELNKLKFSGSSVRYVASDERNTSDVAKAFGTAVGKPALPWVVFSDEQTLEGLANAGIAQEVAQNYTEMGHAFQTGEMLEDYWQNRPDNLGKTKLEDFAKVFAHVFGSN